MDNNFIDLFSGLFTDGKLEVREITPRNEQTGNPKEDFNKVWLYNKKMLKEYAPPKDKECFIGLYSRDRESWTGEKKDTVKTGCLWFDFDLKDQQGISAKDIEYYEKSKFYLALKNIKMQLEMVGLPQPTLIDFSGGGYHVYYKLKKSTRKNIEPLLRNIAPLVGADTSATDIARIMRIPTSYNNKQVYDKPRLVEVIESTNKAYDLDLFKEIANIETLKVYSEDDQPVVKDFKELEKFKSSLKMQCIKNMLDGVVKGQRNFALGRITNKLKYSNYDNRYDLAEKIIIQWNEKNKPSYKEHELLSDFKKYWVEDYKLLGCEIKINDEDDNSTKQDKENKQSILSQFCNKKECKRTFNKNCSGVEVGAVDFIHLPNRIYKHKAIYNNISSYALAIFGILKFNYEGLNIQQLNEKMVSAVTGEKLMGRDARIKAIKELLKFNLIIKIKGNRKQGVKDFYKTNENLKYSLGYTEINYQVIKRFVDGAFTKSEFKLYLLLRSYAYEKDEVYPSQETLSTKIGVSQGRISQIIKELERKEVIKIKVRVGEFGRENYIYQV